jgi:serine/threonine protein kinase
MRDVSNHENIIKLYEVFESFDSFYFVIELIEGITL